MFSVLAIFGASSGVMTRASVSSLSKCLDAEKGGAICLNRAGNPVLVGAYGSMVGNFFDGSWQVQHFVDENG